MHHPRRSPLRPSLRPWHERLRQLLIDRRREAGLTQSELAKKLKRPQTYVQKIEAGDRRVAVVELIEIAGVLGANAEELISDLVQAITAEHDRSGAPTSDE